MEDREEGEEGEKEEGGPGEAHGVAVVEGALGVVGVGVTTRASVVVVVVHVFMSNVSRRGGLKPLGWGGWGLSFTSKGTKKGGEDSGEGGEWGPACVVVDREGGGTGGGEEETLEVGECGEMEPEMGGCGVGGVGEVDDGFTLGCVDVDGVHRVARVEEVGNAVGLGDRSNVPVAKVAPVDVV